MKKTTRNITNIESIYKAFNTAKLHARPISLTVKTGDDMNAGKRAGQHIVDPTQVSAVAVLKMPDSFGNTRDVVLNYNLDPVGPYDIDNLVKGIAHAVVEQFWAEIVQTMPEGLLTNGLTRDEMASYAGAQYDSPVAGWALGLVRDIADCNLREEYEENNTYFTYNNNYDDKPVGLAFVLEAICVKIAQLIDKQARELLNA